MTVAKIVSVPVISYSIIPYRRHLIIFPHPPSYQDLVSSQEDFLSGKSPHSLPIKDSRHWFSQASMIKMKYVFPC
jgi:hypothetical protein